MHMREDCDIDFNDVRVSSSTDWKDVTDEGFPEASNVLEFYFDFWPNKKNTHVQKNLSFYV